MRPPKCSRPRLSSRRGRARRRSSSLVLHRDEQGPPAFAAAERTRRGVAPGPWSPGGRCARGDRRALRAGRRRGDADRDARGSERRRAPAGASGGERVGPGAGRAASGGDGWNGGGGARRTCARRRRRSQVGSPTFSSARERARLYAGDEPVDPSKDDICPFRGLAPFDAAHAKFFFGRERLVAGLVARLVGSTLLAVVGPSGSGKSSLVRAGLLPALANGVLPGSERWRQVLMRPGDRPLAELRRALARLGATETRRRDDPLAAVVDGTADERRDPGRGPAGGDVHRVR